MALTSFAKKGSLHFSWRTLRLTWQFLTGETHTRILFLYALSMLGAIVVAVPIFRALLFRAVDQRVYTDLQEEVELFRATYQTWKAKGLETESNLKELMQSFMATTLPEDDNFHLVFLEGSLFAATPQPLPPELQRGSELIAYWSTLEASVQGSIQADNPDIGSILYTTQVLEVDAIPRGIFVVAHISAGERSEALAAVAVFLKVATGVVLLSFLLAWLGSRQLLQPVKALATTACAINETDLTQRLEVNGSGELANLAIAFNAMMDRVQRAFNSQRDFINDAGHELFTPLTIIQGHLEVMGDDPQEQAETLAIVMDEIDRMSRFVKDLLLLAKADQPNFLQLETIVVAEFMETVFAKVKVLADRHWQLDNRGTGILVGDRQRLTGALINLCKNAVQHTETTDTIELGAVTEGSYVRFWVQDTGEGIALAEQSRIFERFSRVSNRRRKSEGAGLGLAIVKAITESHRGTVELVSQPGMGATFSLVIPLNGPEMEHLT